MIKVSHLLDDFGMGGVTRALTLFDNPSLTRIAKSTLIPISPDARIAPKVDADLVVDHMAWSWQRLVFLMGLRTRNPRAHIVHVEHSYTRAFEATQVANKARFRAMIRLASALVDEVVCVSEAQKSWLEHQVAVPAAKLRVIYPWTNRNELFDVPRRPVVRGRPMQLLAYGRYAAVKNFDTLITAMRGFPKGMIELTVFGDGPERERLEALAADMPHVKILGPCDDPGRHLEACDAVVLPSRYEAFGLVATEARMAGRAILVADVDGLPEQVGQSGLVAPLRTVEEIQNAIFHLTRCDLARMGQEGRREVNGQSSEIILRWNHILKRVKRRQLSKSALRFSPPIRGALG